MVAIKVWGEEIKVDDTKRKGVDKTSNSRS
jgi:hypothetical protein